MMWIWLLWSCRPPQEAPAPEGPRVAFDLTEGSALFDAPFPSAHRMGADGRVRVGDWPNPDALPYVDTLIGLAGRSSGFPTTMGVFFRLEDRDLPLVELDVHGSMEDDAPAFLVAIDGAAAGQRVPVDLWSQPDGGPFGAPGLAVLLPLQGVPLQPDTTYAAVLRRSASPGGLGVPEALWALIGGEAPEGWAPEVTEAYAGALDALSEQGIVLEELAALAVFHTWDPVAEQRRAVAAARALPTPTLHEPLVLTDTFDDFCVLESSVRLPSYQQGTPPFTDSGGGWVFDEAGEPVLQGNATSRLWITVPRTPAPAGGYPVTVMIRTGGGGDRPLVDRGVRGEPGGEALQPGTGPALELARGGSIGVMVDGPHGGPYRNPTGADEQFLMFNIANLEATRDNVRQSALELALLPQILEEITLDVSGCPGADAQMDLSTLGLLGHSMGATIAPLVAATAPEYDALVLSGAGGSYLYNLVYKESPLEVRPLAEALLGYSTIGRTLRPDDPVLQLLQWTGEPSDPPVYAPWVDAHVLMIQGIVDTYILPPMANATSLSLGLDLALPALDADHPELTSFRPLEPLLPLVGRTTTALPATADAMRLVIQAPEDGVEDGHEVLFQTEGPKHQYRCFLEGVARGVVAVPVAGGATDPCP